jgi:phage tail P2-like protein
MAYPTLLPLNSTAGERALEQVMGHISDEPIDIRTVKNFDDCPVEVIPALAWEYGVTYWEEGWTEDQKRSALKSAAAVNKLRGTPGAVKRALAAVGRDIQLVSWHQDTPKAQPYTFRIIISGESVTPEEMQKTYRQAIDAKNGRSWLSVIHIDGPVVSGTVFCGGTTMTVQRSRLKARRRDV